MNDLSSHAGRPIHSTQLGNGLQNLIAEQRINRNSPFYELQTRAAYHDVEI